MFHSNHLQVKAKSIVKKNPITNRDTSMKPKKADIGIPTIKILSDLFISNHLQKFQYKNYRKIY